MADRDQTAAWLAEAWDGLTDAERADIRNTHQDQFKQQLPDSGAADVAGFILDNAFSASDLGFNGLGDAYRYWRGYAEELGDD